MGEGGEREIRSKPLEVAFESSRPFADYSLVAIAVDVSAATSDGFGRRHRRELRCDSASRSETGGRGEIMIRFY